MKSIIHDGESCYLCGRNSNFEPLDWHHVYGGRGIRPLAEKYGLKVRLHHFSCHEFGKDSVHQNAAVRKKLQAHVQKIAMEHYGWTEEDFIKIFGRNYIEEKENE